MSARLCIFVLALGLCLVAAFHAFTIAGVATWGVIFTALAFANFAAILHIAATE
jgi:hypothetical protein